jgi:putative transposase
MINDMLEAGIIKKSDGPWASPLVLVQKKDGAVRICVDYRELNKVTVKNSWPLPTPESILEAAEGKKILQ